MTENAPTISDDYTGEVSVGTGSQRRTLSHATIVKTSVGPMDNNAYLVVCSRTGRSLLVDAANDAPTLRAVVDRVAPEVSLIVTTHQHFDHWQALEDVASATGAPSAAHPLDAEPLPVAPTRLLDDGDSVQVGDVTLDVIHLRGHTPGSIALALTDPESGVVHLFTGDSLFPGGVGKTDGEANFVSLLDDVESRIFGRYDDRTVVYPGHGKDTTLGSERPHLHEWRTRGW
ncbi:MBL fold metallo-hydrolase [Rhodococcus sp. BP-149]|uniref:MBL fold metallo-hydrolase n=1 Tax=unclassified Rhodococcus (in: high G+C Gram-positive bacteria) TaxID=192944 RepID=UPI001C9A4E22|nr:MULTISPECIES: MBL fold metallo-hydrolase [unclassified Rhodococcus (in: high G+C Gram-positive bacteria)]MBY6683707.1 MBL fold metallo-hydrolase [Rhodococcus sp. BP-288]MBY6695178.1 MBL fold metallo-hydrolase [Rhodococcus sp. BP-188]MBY6697829.1 MBL fold metallo-hydrolase [Rhodococcus sp. BP-285]MBY6702506.1 MBL fold metallo-hydrolase [Rhodococcus sp. BP-283]MBY6709561.1 MBL fold metallo-hydrolase [Rhodococcus sp. BP-160]